MSAQLVSEHSHHGRPVFPLELAQRLDHLGQEFQPQVEAPLRAEDNKDIEVEGPALYSL